MAKDASATHTWDQLTTGIPLPTGKRHHLVVPSHELVVRFEMPPEGGAQSQAQVQVDEEKFTLIGGRTKDSPEYQQTKTSKDDLIKGDAYIDIRFTGLLPDLSYWLEVDPGGSQPKYLAFEAVAWDEIRKW